MSGAGGFLADVNDPWLKPRLLRAVVGERLPKPGVDIPPAELASVLGAVRAHGLLTERLPVLHDPKLAEAWRAAVDAWVERVGELMESDLPYSRWLGTCFLGLTFQECSNERFAESYSNWFEKILSNLQEPSSMQLVIVVSCTSMTDLFVRLSRFFNFKKEASSFAGRVVEPALLLLNRNGPVADEAVDLLRTVIKLYPSSVNRHYNKVESAIATNLMSSEVSVKLKEKFARALASLPSVRVSEESWSLMIQKILIVVNNLLNDAFIGLEEEKSGHGILMLLVPPGNDPPPMLGDQKKWSGGNVHVTKKFRVYTVPTISVLIHCCCVMLTSYYPVQVNVPVRALIALTRRVLSVDGSLHTKLFPSTTSLHQELICFELPSLHSTFLDLLSATIKGMRSQLLPHAANIVRLITKYFEIAKLPTMRTKVYIIVQQLLTSMGVGISMHLLEAIVSNSVADLDSSCGQDMTSLSTKPAIVTNESSSKSYSKKRKQEADAQNLHVSGSEKTAISPKKRRNSSMSTTPETTADVGTLTPLSVKLAALETLEILLNVGGSLRTDHWRAEVDLLLINIARSACGTGGRYEYKLSSAAGETSIADFQLASLKALLASFLSSSHARPPYLAQGIELFRRGKLEIGTKLAEFCSHALLALDVLTHPRALSLESAVPSGLTYGASEKAIFGTEQYKFSLSGNKPQALEDDNTYDDWLTSSKVSEPTGSPAKDSPVGKGKAIEMSQGEKRSTPVEEHQQTDANKACEQNSIVPAAIQDVPTSSKSDIEMVDAATTETVNLKTGDNPSSTNAALTPPVRALLPDLNQQAAVVSDEGHTDLVDHLQNKTSAFDVPLSKTVTGGEAPPSGSSSHLMPSSKTDDSDVESEDSMPGIVDGDPDSD
uniref:Pre-rRNA-processing protein RIX1 N-terminal domain-containing protein n=1 Tax=Leersia perrieri TaxID=77586 RepID=A0A0D9WER0_9ORYZ